MQAICSQERRHRIRRDVARNATSQSTQPRSKPESSTFGRAQLQLCRNPLKTQRGPQPHTGAIPPRAAPRHPSMPSAKEKACPSQPGVIFHLCQAPNTPPNPQTKPPQRLTPQTLLARSPTPNPYNGIRPTDAKTRAAANSFRWNILRVTPIE